jgi:ribonuclease HI
MKPQVEIFTDGSCPRLGGPGGWAYILRNSSTGKELRRSGGLAETTNNRMELMGVIQALRSLPVPCRIILCSDSEYVLKGILEWLPNWKRKNWIASTKEPVKNVDLWKIIDELKSQHEITSKWVRGHTGHPENEWCDEAASVAGKNCLVSGT